MHYRLADARVNSSTNSSRLYEKIVQIGSVVFEFGVEYENWAATQPKLDDIRSVGILAFWNGLEYHNFDFSTLIGNDLYTNHENLVRLGLVILEF